MAIGDLKEDPQFGIVYNSTMKEKYIRRFWNKVNKTDTCWNWTASTANNYGAYGYRPDGTTKSSFKFMSAQNN